MFALWAALTGATPWRNSTGDLRYRLPVGNDPYQGIYNATEFGLACPQQNATSEADLSVLPPQTLEFYLNNYTKNFGAGDEDCKCFLRSSQLVGDRITDSSGL